MKYDPREYNQVTSIMKETTGKTPGKKEKMKRKKSY